MAGEGAEPRIADSVRCRAVTHADDVAYIMGEVAERAARPLPLARDLRRVVLDELDVAASLADHELPVPGGRLGRARRLVLDLVRPSFDRQSRWNLSMVVALRHVEAVTTVVEERLKRGWVNLDLRLGEIQRGLDQVRDRVGRDEAASAVAVSLQVTSAELQLEIATLAREVEQLRSEQEEQAQRVRAERARIDAVLDAIATPGLLAGDGEVAKVVTELASRSLDELYTAFELEFRGSLDDVKELQRPYLAFVRDASTPDLPWLDIGPGRGEWLQLLAEEGLAGYGVDLNADLAERSRGIGLDVRHGDALLHLQGLDEGSLAGISAFHFIEHLPFEAQLKFLRHATRALAPGGRLLLETPNPTNLVVGAAAFYLDPTHIRPMHPQLLRFLVEAQGLVDVTIEYVHPAEATPVRDTGDEARDALYLAVDWALYGPQDYALVAKKAAVPAA
jgi:SAM-dependent methyltransferase